LCVQVVFEYLEQKKLVKMQAINKRRFYKIFMPDFIRQVKLYELGSVSKGFCIFSGKSAVNILSPINLQWTSLLVSENPDDEKLKKEEADFQSKQENKGLPTFSKVI